MNNLIKSEDIQNKIYTFRGVQVMIDRDLAELYGVDTRRLNEQVKRNIERFPTEFMFQLNEKELEHWKSQIAISNKEKMGLRKLPYVFTEQGVAMLSAVLKSETAIKVSIHIIGAFVAMRRFMLSNAQIFQRLDTVEIKQINADKKIDKIDKVLTAIEIKNIEPKQGIFFNGQIFDAYKFVSDLIRNANKSILLIDNYIDETTLNLFSKKKNNVEVKIFTNKITNAMAHDVKKFNDQYPTLELKKFSKAHDRFLIIDNRKVYHFGASLKDLGKKLFAFSKMDSVIFSLLENLKKDNLI